MRGHAGRLRRVPAELLRAAQPVRVFLAGATGVIGTRLVPLLVEQGHEVAGMTRSAEKAGTVRELGAEPVVCDVYDASRLTEVVAAFAPDLVMHQLTDLPDDMKRIALYMRRNNRIRTEGTDNLLAAAKRAGAERFLAQSIAFAPPGARRAVKRHERMVLDAGGVVLRYGWLYGPGAYSETGRGVPSPRIHLDAAAQRTWSCSRRLPGCSSSARPRTEGADFSARCRGEPSGHRRSGFPPPPRPAPPLPALRPGRGPAQA